LRSRRTDSAQFSTGIEERGYLWPPGAMPSSLILVDEADVTALLKPDEAAYSRHSGRCQARGDRDADAQRPAFSMITEEKYVYRMFFFRDHENGFG
jgi:hypothetical protein